SVVPKLIQLVCDSQGQLALEALWALHLVGGFTGDIVQKTLAHSEPQVRLWAVRFLGEEAPPALGTASMSGFRELARLARREPDVEVRAQLACTARRLPGEQALPIVVNLLSHDEDANDPRLP